MAGNFYGFSAQAPDLSFVGQAGAIIGNTIQQLPATIEAENKRALLKTQLEQLKLDVPKAEEVRRQRIAEAVKEYQTELGLSDDQMTDRIKTGIEARYYSPIMGDEQTDPGKAILRWSDADTKFQANLKVQKEQLDKTRGASAAQSVVGPQRVSNPAADLSIGPPEQITTPGAATQEQALSMYGDLTAAGRAPVMKAEDVKQYPEIAALPKAPEPEKPLTAYQKWEMKFKEDDAKAKKIEDSLKSRTQTDKEKNDNFKWAMNSEIEYLAGSKTAKDKASRLKTALIKLKSGKTLDANEVADLSDGPTDLESLQKEYENANDMILASKEAARKFGAMAKLINDGMSPGDAAKKYDTDATNSAVSVVKDQATRAANEPPIFDATPGILKPAIATIVEAAGKKYDTNLQVILNRLPSETRLIIERKIDEARAQGLSDQDIATRLLAAGK
jgi:hypothetical protein